MGFSFLSKDPPFFTKAYDYFHIYECVQLVEKFEILFGHHMRRLFLVENTVGEYLYILKLPPKKCKNDKI